MGRQASRDRTTKETSIRLVLELDGTGAASAATGIPFFDHMLEQLGKHAGLDLEIRAEGDLEVDLHHTVEDVGIALGECLREALGDKAGIRRFASALVPLDEALVQVALDCSGRPFLVYEVEPVSEWIGTFDPQLCEEFWRAVAVAAGLTLHIRSLSGRNGHHVIEASFKGVARALRDAVKVEGGGIPGAEGHALSGFTVFPTIDVRAGRAVRLHQGDFGAETVYDDDPVRVATAFAAAGAEWLHVVDLDAARTGEPANLAVVEAIAAAVPLRIQTGGGVRSVRAAEALFLAGATRVVIGTAAVESPELVDEIAAAHPGGVVVGLDARGDDVAIRGWTAGSGHSLAGLAARFEGSGIAALVVTEISRDGTMEGPSLDQLRAALGATALPVVASGGIGGIGDLEALVRLRAEGPASEPRELAGAIVGRAIYEGRLTVAEALAAARPA